MRPPSSTYKRQRAPQRGRVPSPWMDSLAVFFLFVILAVFFFRMFFPRLQILATPDFGLSDAWHFSFATKFALGDALHKGTLPLWQPDIGDGFPLLGEGQTGMFFLPNLILFRFFPPALAYGIALVSSIGFLGAGTYLFLRTGGFTLISSFFAASVFMFSGLPILQLPHITLLQGMGLLPWIMVLTQKLQSARRPALWTGLLSLFITQQIFTGFPQATFLTAVLAGSFLLFGAYREKRYGAIFFLAASYVLGALGAAAQLLPSREFLAATTHPHGFDYVLASQFSMPLKHLVTFFNPFVLGNPKEGTYPAFYQFGGSIFWENTTYVGLLPLFFAAIGLVKNKRSSGMLFWLAVLIGSIIMAWGKNSPLYFIYSIWPFTYFRVPSRFLWLAAFSVIMLASYGIDSLVRKPVNKYVRFLVCITLPIALIQLLSAWWSYHLLIPASDLLAMPAVARSVQGKTIYPLGSEKIHNGILFSKGWSKPEPYLSLYTAGLGADGNLVYGIREHDVYAGRSLYRSTLADTLLTTTLERDDHMATVSSRIMLDLLGIERLVSFIPVDKLPESEAFQTPAGEVRIYANDKALPRAYMVRHATSAATLVEANSRMLNPDFTAGRDVLLETADVNTVSALRQFIAPSDTVSGTLPVSVNRTDMGTVDLHADAGGTPAILVLMDTYYPGWHAYVDGKETRIYPANIKQRAIVIPPGSHTVRFRYMPESLLWGAAISTVTELIVLLLTATAISGRAHGISKIVLRIFSRHRYSHAT